MSGNIGRPVRLGDYSADRRMVLLCLMSLPVGTAAAASAWLLLHLISFFTNLFWFGQLSWDAAEITDAAVGPVAILIPIAGALIIGIMARFGSKKIRGHGIPEAMETILYGESRLSPKVAVLKPLSSAISIGSGGPFGAEGPIIMTGGAVGSLFAQCFRMSAAERKTLLVAGAAAGMTAIFATPIAAILLAVELLLFEWKPRSLLPVISAVLIALGCRTAWLGSGPLFVAAAAVPRDMLAFPGAVALGLIIGLASSGSAAALYRIEDAFQKLPFHWMWFPALGGLVVGAGGVLDPRVLGAGYGNIADLLSGSPAATSVATLLTLKAVVWLVALGSGTSGGVLAPLLILGGSIGWLSGLVLPGSESFWALMGMAAVMSSGMRAPLTGILFAAELTGRYDAMPMLAACAATAYGLSVLVDRRSILTEKIARRGKHLLQEYGIDPLDVLQAAELMTAKPETLAAQTTLAETITFFAETARHRSYPVIDMEKRLVGLVSRSDALGWRQGAADLGITLEETLSDNRQLTAHPETPCAKVAELMIQSGIGRIPVISATDGKVLGIITRHDLLRARTKQLHEETVRTAPHLWAHRNRTGR